MIDDILDFMLGLAGRICLFALSLIGIAFGLGIVAAFGWFVWSLFFQ